MSDGELDPPESKERLDALHFLTINKCETPVKAAARIQSDYSKLSTLRAENELMREALESIAEYWNRDRNDSAMHDACWHAINTAEEVIARNGLAHVRADMVEGR